MKKFTLRLLSMLMLLTVCCVGWASELTVNDGTGNNDYVPVYGLYVDNYIHTQIIYPAASLANMTGEEIHSMKFYLKSSASASWGAASFEIRLSEVSVASFSSAAWNTENEGTLVYSGELDGTGEEMDVVFTTDYTYNGGNLLFDLVSTAKGSWKSASFYGVSTTGASVSGYSSTSAASASATDRSFLPKTTFDYGAPPTCLKPSGLVATLTPGNGAIADLSWTAGGSETAWVLEYGTVSDFSGATSVNISGTPSKDLTGLIPETTYYARVKADCGGGDESEWSAAIEFTPTMAAFIGDGTSTTGYAPLYGNYKSSYVQMIYTASQLGAVGINTEGEITKIGFNSSATNSKARNVKIYMGHTDKTQFTDASDFVTYNDLELVYDYEAHDQWSIVAGWNDFDLDAPFDYDGSSNLVIAVYCGLIDGYSSSSFYYSATTDYQVVYAYSDTDNPNPASFDPSAYSGSKSNSKNLPNLKVLYTASLTPKPKNLAVSNISAHGVTLSWEAPDIAPDHYEYQFKKSSEVNWSSAESISDLSVVLSNLDESANYDVRVRAIFAVGESKYVTTSFTTLADCAVPFNLTVSEETAFGATIAWEGNSDSYEVSLAKVVVSKSSEYTFEDGQFPTDLTHSGSYGFEIVSGQSESGNYCVKSSNGGVSSSTADMVLSVDLTEAANLTFSAKISSESGYDKGYFSIDGTDKINAISGVGAWIDYSFPLAAGAHSLRWYYTKDSGVNSNDDCFYVDDIVISNSSIVPVTVYPVSASPFELDDASNIASETTYMIAVKGICGSDETEECEPVSFTTTPSCLAVSGLTLGEVTTNSVSFTWTDASEQAQWQWAIVTAGGAPEWSDNIVSLKVANVDGLTANTSYDFYVRAYCGSEDQSAAVKLSFRTECALVSVADAAWSEGFEGDLNADNSLPYCWSKLSASVTYPYVYSYGAKTGSKFLHFYGGGSAPQIAVLPQFEQPLSELVVSFYHHATSGASYGKLQVGYLTDASDSTTFVLIEALDQSSSYVLLDELSLASVPSAATHLAIRYSGGTSSYGYAYVDDIEVKLAPTCVKPTALAADNITATSAELSWTAGGSETAWTLYYKKSSDENYEGIPVTSSSHTLDNLDASSSYMFYIVADCSSTDHSDESAVFSFDTECGAVALPFNCEFNAASDLQCWTMEDCHASTGISNSSFAFHWSSNPPQYLISPELAITSNLVKVQFDYKAYGDNYPESFQVGYSSTDNVISSFTWGEEVENITETTYQPYSIVCPAGTKYVAIKCTSDDQFYLYIDNFSVSELTPISVTINASRYATFYSDEAAYVMPVGVTGHAYTVDALGKGHLSDAFYSNPDVVPAGTPLVLEGDAGTYSFVPSMDDGFQKFGDNELEGVSEVTLITDETGYTNFVLSLAAGNIPGETSCNYETVGFYWVGTAGVELQPNRAYLKVDNSKLSTNGAPAAFFLIDDENNATWLNNLKGVNSTLKFWHEGHMYILRDSIIYDATGKKVREVE